MVLEGRASTQDLGRMLGCISGVGCISEERQNWGGIDVSILLSPFKTPPSNPRVIKLTDYMKTQWRVKPSPSIAITASEFLK